MRNLQVTQIILAAVGQHDEGVHGDERDDIRPVQRFAVFLIPALSGHEARDRTTRRYAVVAPEASICRPCDASTPHPGANTAATTCLDVRPQAECG